MKVVYGYRRDGEDKPILIKDCTFDFDKAKGRLTLRNYNLCDKFKEADKFEMGSPYASAIEENGRREFIRFAEAAKIYPTKYGLYVDRESVTIDTNGSETTTHCRLTCDIAKALRLDKMEDMAEWKGFKAVSKSIYGEDKR